MAPSLPATTHACLHIICLLYQVALPTLMMQYQLQGPIGAAQQLLRTNPAVGVAVSVAVGFLGVTFLVALVRTGLKAMSPEAKRGRTINKNKVGAD